MDNVPVANDASQRKARRSRSLLKGTLLELPGARCMPCGIKDFSDAGARLSTRAASNIFGYNYLLIHKHSTLYRIEFAWHQVEELGVKFIETVPVDKNLPPDLLPAYRLWIEHQPRPAVL